MSTQNNSIGQKVRCANHRSVIECDGWVGTRVGSKYCADCRTTIDFVCAECGEMRSMPRGLYQILTAQGKKTKCFDCLHGGNGNNREAKPAAERKQNPKRKQDKIHDSRVRLHRQLHDPALDTIVKKPISRELATHIQAAFPGTMFVWKSGHLLPAHGLGITYPDENRRPKLPAKPKPITVKLLLRDPDEIRQTAMNTAQMYALERGVPKKYKDSFYWAKTFVVEHASRAESITNKKVYLGVPRAIINRVNNEDAPNKERWSYIEEATYEVNRFLRRLLHDGNLQRRCGIT